MPCLTALVPSVVNQPPMSRVLEPSVPAVLGSWSEYITLGIS
jgi:hypothetical protein